MKTIAVTKEAVVVGASVLVVGLIVAIDFKGKDHPAWLYIGTFIADSPTGGFMKPLGNEWFCNQII